jgi:hypothetical protein
MDIILSKLSADFVSPMTALSYQIDLEGGDASAVYRSTKRMMPRVRRKLDPT